MLMSTPSQEIEPQSNISNTDAQHKPKLKSPSLSGEDRQIAVQDEEKQTSNAKHSSNSNMDNQEIDEFELALNEIVFNAKCYNDLSAILQHIELEEIKEFVQQQIKKSIPMHLYFKSMSIIDVCGVDVVRKCLSYLSLNELYKTRMICTTFAKLRRSIVSSSANVPCNSLPLMSLNLAANLV